jgi:hypothetical protein
MPALAIVTARKQRGWRSIDESALNFIISDVTEVAVIAIVCVDRATKKKEGEFGRPQSPTHPPTAKHGNPVSKKTGVASSLGCEILDALFSPAGREY